MRPVRNIKADIFYIISDHTDKVVNTSFNESSAHKLYEHYRQRYGDHFTLIHCDRIEKP